jgi:hypothetical protein
LNRRMFAAEEDLAPTQRSNDRALQCTNSGSKRVSRRNQWFV